jgi:NitT/TauT family transport system substrate-binding protein
VTLRIAHLSTFYHTSILLIARGDMERRLGADVEWTLYGTGPDIVGAFEEGLWDLAYIGLPPAMIGMARGLRFKCVAGGHIEGTVLAGESGLREARGPEGLREVFLQLAGRRVGVPGRGSIHDVILSDSLERFGLSGEVEVVNYRWADMITEALARGEVAAAMGTPALAVALRRYAGGKILVPPSMLWPSNPSYGIVASEEAIRKNSRLVEAFLSIHEEAAGFLRERPREAAEAIASHVGVVDADFVAETLALSPRFCAQLTEAYVSSTMEFEAALRRLGYTKRKLEAGDIFEPSLIRKVHPPGDHY